MIRTHHVYNPTGSTVTVGANSVTTHATKILVLADQDAAAFATASCTITQLGAGVADAATLAAEEAGFLRGF